MLNGTMGASSTSHGRSHLLRMLLLFAVAACANPPPDAPPVYGAKPGKLDQRKQYTFGVIPLHEPVLLFAEWQPILDAVNASQDRFSLRFEAGRDYAHFEAKLRARSVELAVLNPYQAVTFADQGYRIFAKMGDDASLRGIIVVRKGDPIGQPTELKGERLAFASPTGIAGLMMNKAWLHERGLDLDRDCEVIYVGSQTSTLLNVFLGTARAAGTWPAAWETLQREQPEVARGLEVRWQTPPLVNVALAARVEVPEADVQAITQVLFGLHQSAAGRKILSSLELSRFEPATEATYAPVRVFLEDYRARFGSLPTLRVPEEGNP